MAGNGDPQIWTSTYTIVFHNLYTRTYTNVASRPKNCFIFENNRPLVGCHVGLWFINAENRFESLVFVFPPPLIHSFVCCRLVVAFVVISFNRMKTKVIVFLTIYTISDETCCCCYCFCCSYCCCHESIRMRNRLPIIAIVKGRERNLPLICN